MPSRLEIIEKVGKEYIVENIENGEFSYPKALKLQGKSTLQVFQVKAFQDGL